MNKQEGNNRIEWTEVFGAGTGYTWNVVSGCARKCQWKMPDGNIATCYAKDVALGVAQQFYPLGFEHSYWHPERLVEPMRHKKPAGIFLDSMSDLMGHNVPQEQIEQVLDVCRSTPQHIYFLLTKNAPRLELFNFPANVWVGVSSPPDFMFDKQLDRSQQAAMLERAKSALAKCNAKVRWMSIEPLSWPMANYLLDAPLDWVVIGAASNGKTHYQPEAEAVRNVLRVLDRKGTAVFFKGNLRGNAGISEWREEYPVTAAVNA